MIHGLPQGFLVSLASLFPIMNPIGALPPFVGLTQGQPHADQRRQAVRTAISVFALLAVFALVGRPLLHALGITLPALQVGGGLVVAASGFGMVRGGSGGGPVSSAEHDHAQAKPDVSFSPMAMPLLAGPGALGVVIALAARSSGAPAIGGLVLGALAMALLVGVLLTFGTPLVDRLGATGVGALTRIFGFLILAIGVELVSHGLLAVFPGLAH